MNEVSIVREHGFYVWVVGDGAPDMLRVCHGYIVGGSDEEKKMFHHMIHTT